MDLKEKSYMLNATDRCDRCYAQAYVWVNGIAGELLFCGHHYKENEESLKSYAIEIVDERDKL